MNTFFLVTQPLPPCPDIIMYVYRTEKKSVGLRGWCKTIRAAVYKDDWWTLHSRTKVWALFETAYFDDPTKDKYLLHACHTCEDCEKCLPISGEPGRLICLARDEYTHVRLACLNGFVPNTDKELPFLK